MMIRIVFCLFCAFGILAREAHAQLFLEDGKVTLAVSGGDHLNGTLLIHNTSADPADIKVYWEDFEYKSPYDGTKKFLPAGTAPESASQWVTFSPQEFTMPGFGSQKIEYDVTAPAQVQEGHYGVLFFERSASPNKSDNGLTLVTRVGCLFFIEPKNKSKNALLQDVVLKTKSVKMDFVNQGNVILIPRTTYYIMQDSGIVLSRGESKRLYVPPGVSASLEIPLNKKLNPGKYTLVVNSDLGEGDVVVKEIGLTADDSGQVTVENSQN